MTPHKPLVWSIGGSDSGGGAGIQADVLTVADLGAHCCTVLCAVTAQNSQQVAAVFALPASQLTAQLDALWQDLPPQAIKIGMLANAELLQALVSWLAPRQTALTAAGCLIIWDPVLIASSGVSPNGQPLTELSQSQALQLLPLLDLLTPNLPELAFLTASDVAESADSEAALQQLAQLRLHYSGAVLLKGGHQQATGNGLQVCDLWLAPLQPVTQATVLQADWLELPHRHGTGCTLASAIATALALQYPLNDAVVLGRAYVQQGIRAGYATGQGAGALARLGWPWQQQDFPWWRPRLMPVKALSFAPLIQPLGLYPVVDSLQWLIRLLPYELTTIQLRLKDLPPAELAFQISQAVVLCHDYNIQLFINDHWQLAIEYGAFGVHLGQQDLNRADLAKIAEAGLRLGVSTHGYAELARVFQLNPSYIALGHVFATQTKQMPSSPQGLSRLADYVWLCAEVPTVAIGGINLSNIQSVMQTGVSAVAVVSAITQAPQPEKALQKLQQYCHTVRLPRTNDTARGRHAAS